jgi:abequosyltransferase
MPFVLDILIPTYNRSVPLKKNLDLLAYAIRDAQLEEQVRILISDNASTDNTRDMVRDAARELGVSIVLSTNRSNLGLEPNVVDVLSRASAPYIMFLGDDDYLPNGYIEHVVRTMSDPPSRPLCIIPGFSALLPDGRVRPGPRWRRAGRSSRTKPSRTAAVRLAPMGHQLSGLVLPRNNLIGRYLETPEFRNIYPFIFFLGYALINYSCDYLPHFQVLVSQGNAKDWRYDDSGLLSEVAKSYRALFGRSFWYTLAMVTFIWHNPWRLRVGLSPRPSLIALRHLAQFGHVGATLIAVIGALLPLLYARHLVGRAKEAARWVT